MTWVAHLVRTVDGRKGARLDITGEGSWSIPAVGIEDFEVTVSKAQLRSIDRDWWRPYQASVVVSWESATGVTPWVMGPIVKPPTGETETLATLVCRGLGALLERRVVLDQDYGFPGAVDESAIAGSVVRREGMSLGTIAQDIVRLSTGSKLGGHLPIRYGSPRETGSGLNGRTFEGFNLANNNTWKRLMEMSEVDNGPDIQFRPAFKGENYLEWVMVHGTIAQPSIAQDWTMDLDTTSSTAPVADVTIRHDATDLTNRTYWTGAGQGAGTIVRMRQSLHVIEDGMPLLESVGSTSDSDSSALVAAHGYAYLAANLRPLRQITVQVDGSDVRAEFGRWHAGDTARVTLDDSWLTVPAGTRPLKIIAAKGRWDSPMVDLEFQEESM